MEQFEPTFECLKGIEDHDALKDVWEKNKNLHSDPKFVEEKNLLKAKIIANENS